MQAAYFLRRGGRAQKSRFAVVYHTGEYTLLPREKNTPEQLCALAREYYNRNYDFEPPEAAITDNGDGTYTIHLYELVTLDQGETHTATSAWYTVDAYGVGINDITGQLVQLAQ